MIKEQPHFYFCLTLVVSSLFAIFGSIPRTMKVG